MRKTLILFLISIFMIACTPAESGRLLGFGTQRFLNEGKINKGNFALTIDESYDLVVEAIYDLGGKHYRGSRKAKMIIALGFDKAFPKKCIDTTEVAVFFNSLDNETTELKVSSLNFTLSDLISEELFSRMRSKE